METIRKKPEVLVLSIPAGLSAAEVQRLMNEPLRDGSYYFGGVTAYAPGALAFFRLRAEKQREENPAPDEDAALALLKANPRLSRDKMVALLAARGIKRGQQWVYTRRAEIDLRAS